MIQSSRAIVLNQLKYSETSVIVNLYTEAYGRQSYIVNGIRSSKAKTKIGLLQPLFLLEIEAYHKPGREVQRLKEFKLGAVYNEIPFDIIKSTMSMFLAELLGKILRNEEPDQTLFEFIHNALIYFDSLERNAANFHIWFLIRLLSYLGFQLENNRSSLNCFFDIKLGRFVPYRPSFPNTPDTEESEYLSKLIRMEADEIQELEINGALRSRVLSVILEYYSVHFDGIGTINSLAILHEIFH